MSQFTRYYLVRGDPEPIAAVARSTLTNAGFVVEGRTSLPDCSSNSEPPATTCHLSVALSDGFWRLELVVFDRAGAAFLRATPWFASSQADEIVVRITVYG